MDKQNIVKNNLNTNAKGITLLALVFTVALMLILLRVIGTVMYDDNIFESAQEQEERGEKQIAETQEDVNEVLTQWNEITNGVHGTLSGTITFSNIKWNEEQASITVNTDTSYQITYQINGVGNWNNTANGGTISNLKNGDIIYARLINGEQYGELTTYEIKKTL